MGVRADRRWQILALTDTGAEWSEKLGFSVDLSKMGLGVRTARYALIVDDLVVKYAEVRAPPFVSRTR
jgi:alkyl hydroperoxide reductase 1